MSTSAPSSKSCCADYQGTFYLFNSLYPPSPCIWITEEKAWQGNIFNTNFCLNLASSQQRFQAEWIGASVFSYLQVTMYWLASGLGSITWRSDPFPQHEGDCFLQDTDGSLTLNFLIRNGSGPCGLVDGTNSSVTIHVD